MLTETPLDLFSRLDIEIAKYMDITTIFKRLKEQGYLTTIHSMFNQIFETEYQYTIQELIKMAQIHPISFNIAEHYKMNSHIFKQNIALITNLVVDDLWVTFNTRMQTQLKDGINVKNIQLLEPIQEVFNENGFDKKMSPITDRYINLEDSNDKFDQRSITKQRFQKGVTCLSENAGAKCGIFQFLTNRKIADQNVQEYRKQLEMINQMRLQKANSIVENQKTKILINSYESVQLSQKKQSNVNSSSKKDQTNGHQKSNSYSQEVELSKINSITPSQQNYKTMQYLTTMVKEGSSSVKAVEPNEINVMQSAIYQKNWKSNQQNPNYESHIQALGQKDNFQQIIKQSRQNSSNRIKQ